MGRRGAPGRIATALVAAVGALALVAGCTQDVERGSPATPLGTGEVALSAVDDCDALVEATRAQLTALVGVDATTTAGAEVFEESAPPPAPAADGFEAGASSDAAGSGSAQRQASGGAELSAGEGGDVVAGTNNQEQGVDEGDLVKTDGRRIVTVVDGVLRTTVLDGSPAVDGTLDLRRLGARELFLRGDEALVIGDGSGSYPGPTPMPRPVPERGLLPEPAPLPEQGPTAAGGDDGRARTDPTAPPVAAGPDDPPGTTTSTVPGTAPTTTAPEPLSTTSTTTPTTTTTTTEAPTTTTTVVEPELPFATGVTLARVDLSDPSAPRLVESTQVEGSLAASRLVGDVARVVVRTSPVVMERLWSSGDPAAVVDELSAEDVLPRRTAPDGDVVSVGGCDDVLVVPASPPPPDDVAGRAASLSIAPAPEQVTVLTVGDSLAELGPVTVQGGAETTYASTRRLFVTSSSWGGSGPVTAVHRFDLTGDGPAAYTGSGLVPGSLLNQYSLSEDGEDLRVVTTTEGTGDAPVVGPAVEPGPGVDFIAPVPASEGRLAVLRPGDGGTLREIGHVEDLGVGERVKSVRFLGDLAYVVTFRQTDPLYAIDVSDPTAPRVLGELKIPGFSEYLHPVGDGLLLGVGSEADESTGRVTGFKLSLFDVSDPTDPRELDTVVRPDASSPVAQEPLAFSWDPVRRQAVVPLSDFGCPFDDPRSCPGGDWAADELALVVGVGEQAMEERGELRHGGWTGGVDPAIRRSVVVGDDLWTVSAKGLGRTPATSPTTVELLPYT